MQTALATDYNGQSRDRGTIRATLKTIADAGITHVHWAHEWAGDYFFTADDIAFIRDALKEYGLGVKGIHASNGWYYQKAEGFYKTIFQAVGRTDIASMDESFRRKGSDLVHNRLQLAEAVGAREIVLHVQVPYVLFKDPDYTEKYYGQVFKTLDENEAYARETGVRVCIENMVGTPNDIQFDEFDRLFDRYAPDYLGYCCDTGHCILTDRYDPFCIPRKYADRLHMMHLNDNHGYAFPGDFSDDCGMSWADEHIVMGDGIIDFDAFAEIVARSPYDMPVVGEFSIHKDEESAFLNRCREQMERFTQKVLALRAQ